MEGRKDHSFEEKMRISVLEEIRVQICEVLNSWKACELTPSTLEILYPDNWSFGDLSLNIALKLSKILKMPPRKLAEEIVPLIKASASLNSKFRDIQIAGPGFINLYYSDSFYKEILLQINNCAGEYGANRSQNGKSVLIEFVSANPTGPLTIAHARQAVVGDVLYRIYNFCGAKAQREYYLNDKGVQITTLGKSVFLRYLEAFGKTVVFPEDCYQGEYVREIALTMKEKYGDKYLSSSEEEGAAAFRDEAATIILADIKKDLSDFRVSFDSFFSEKSLALNNKIQECLDFFKSRSLAYEKEGALWFASSNFSDDKDRVLVKSNGEQTYLASDIPYHQNKLQRGYDLLIDILGPDHHGYIGRLQSAVEALGYSKEKLKVIILQLTTLYKGGVQLRMSTRKATYITLRELLDEVGADASRYFLTNRKTDTHLDFDLELAKKQTPDNPVFYVQYAFARISSILSKAQEKDPSYAEENLSFDIQYLGDAEKKLVTVLCRFPDVVADAAANQDPQRLSTYLEQIAGLFQSYYSGGNKIITEDKQNTLLKLMVCRCFKQVIENGLKLLGIHAPERM